MPTGYDLPGKDKVDVFAYLGEIVRSFREKFGCLPAAILFPVKLYPLPNPVRLPLTDSETVEIKTIAQRGISIFILMHPDDYKE